MTCIMLKCVLKCEMCYDMIIVDDGDLQNERII